MGRRKRPRDIVPCAKLVCDLLAGEVPNDKAEVLEAMSYPEPVGRAKSAKARTASQTPERRSEIAKSAASVRWGT